MLSQKKIRKSGSVNIPVAMRREMGLEPNDAVDITMSNDGAVVIRPLAPKCIICGSQEDIASLSGKNICKECAKKVLEVLEAGDLNE